MVGMKCKVATAPSSPAYTTVVSCDSAHTSHSLPSRYLDTSPPGMARRKHVMRPFWLLAPKPPRKYPLTETSPNFGLGGGGGAVGAGGVGAEVSVSGAAGVAPAAGACWAAAPSADCGASASVGSWARA